MDFGLATLLGGALSAGASTASAISSGKMNRRAVKYNKWALQEQQRYQTEQAQIGREWSEDMMNKQNDWNLAQWNRENEYNTASAQAQRFLQAGLNPALMMGQGNAGQASSVTSASPANAPNPSSPSAQSLNLHVPDYSGISAAVNSYFSNRSLATQSEGQGIENALNSEFGRRERQVNLGRTESEIAKIRSDTALNYANTMMTGLQADAQRTLNKYLDFGQQVSLFSQLADIAVRMTEKELNSARTHREFAELFKVKAETRGIEVSNRIALETMESAINALNEENKLRKQDAVYGQHFNPNKWRLENGILNEAYFQSQVDSALKAFENYVTNTPGNRWIKKNITPVLQAADPIVQAALLHGAGKALKGVSTVMRSRPKIPKYSWEK